MNLQRALVSLLLLSIAASAGAADRTWTGAINGLWSTPGNWSGGVAPAAGDTLLFGAGGSNRTMTNDLPAGTTFASIRVVQPLYAVSGNAIGLSESLDVSQPFTISVPIVLQDETEFFARNALVEVNGPVDLNGNTLRLVNLGGDGAIAGAISGAGTILKYGTLGTLQNWTLSGANTFTGPITVMTGRLTAASAQALGAGDGAEANGTTVNAGASLVVDNAAVGNEWISISGAGFEGSGALSTSGTNAALGGSLVLADETVKIVVLDRLTLNTRVTGPGTFRFDGTGTIVINNPLNDFAGPFVWNTEASQTDIVFGADQAIPATKSLHIPSMANVDLEGHSLAVVTTEGWGVVAINSVDEDGLLTLTNPGGESWQGQWIGAGDVVVRAGSIRVGGPEVITGDLRNEGAAITIDGARGATISGLSPATRYLQLAGSLQPVHDVWLRGPVEILGGSMRLGFEGNGRVRTGNLRLGPGVTVEERITSAAAGGYGSAEVVGTVIFTEAVLSLSVAAASPAGTTFRLIDNDGAEAVAGVFAGLPEGATVSGGLQRFVISYAGGTGNDVVLTALAVASETTLNIGPSPSGEGQNVILTAAVEGFGTTPVGTITFFDGATPIGTSTLDATGHATFSTSALTLGTHTITAVYSGSAIHTGSTSPALTHEVLARAATTTTVVAAPNPSTFGQTVTFTVEVDSALATTRTGTVSIHDGATLLGTVALVNNAATFTTSALSGGSHSITATYNGDNLFLPSTSAAISQQVNVAATTTALQSSANPAIFGQTITFTATVTSGGGTPAGTVTFLDGATVLGTATLTNGVATFAVNSLQPGNHSITARYEGNANFGPSTSAALTQVVSAAAAADVPTLDPGALALLAVAIGIAGLAVVRRS